MIVEGLQRVGESAMTASAGESHPWCTVVIPCYNEASRFRMQSFSDFLKRDQPIGLLFVNDGSRDRTIDLIEELRLSHPSRVSVIDKELNGGKAEAVRDGMLGAIAAGADFVGFWDADLATPLDSIPELLAKLREGRFEMVFGARVSLLGRHVSRKPMRHYLGRIFATVVSTMLKLPIYDTQCGAKLFRVTGALKEILASPFKSRWIFDVEIIARFLQVHRTDPNYVHDAIYEFPLQTWIDVEGSKLGRLDFIRAFRDLIRIRRTYLG